MAKFETFHTRITKNGADVSFSENGDVTVKTTGDFTFNGDISFKKTDKPALTLAQYQEGAISTAIYDEKWKLIYPALKLTGEAGEVSEKIGKAIRDKSGEFSDEFKVELAKELGDVLWYIAALARDIGYTLEQVGQMNLDKLASRKARGVIGGSGDNR